MSNIAIRVEGLSKQYRIGTPERYRTLRDTLADTLTAPFRRRTREAAGQADNTFWALKDVSFEVKHGEVIGIVGRNGAGKSTLLKILSRITEPTEGQATIHGRVASLLEVGTGFHPELTGRDNIYLNGAILGMKRAEIRGKFDEIVAFAEVDKFIDTPVKHYSSGMYVRLAFAVAAHLEPEILIVDEVLAVGDAQFQKKCLGRMSEVARDGRTVLFVSHNLPAVLQLTGRSALLQQGELKFFGPTSEALERYSNSQHTTSETVFDVSRQPRKYPGNGIARLVSLRFDGPLPIFQANDDFEFYATVQALEDIVGMRCSMTVFQSDGTPVGSCFGPEAISMAGNSITEVKITLPKPRLAPGRYHCGLAIGKGNHRTGHVDFDVVQDTLRFEVLPEVADQGTVAHWTKSWGAVRLEPLHQSVVQEAGHQYERDRLFDAHRRLTNAPK